MSSNPVTVEVAALLDKYLALCAAVTQHLAWAQTAGLDDTGKAAALALYEALHAPAPRESTLDERTAAHRARMEGPTRAMEQIRDQNRNPAQ